MRFVVTQSDYDNGEPNDPYSCPVALAMQRRTEYGVMVESHVAHLGIWRSETSKARK